MIFKKKIFLNEIDSTNNYLIELEKKINIDEGLVLITDYQNNGCPPMRHFCNKVLIEICFGSSSL